MGRSRVASISSLSRLEHGDETQHARAEYIDIVCSICNSGLLSDGAVII